MIIDHGIAAAGGLPFLVSGIVAAWTMFIIGRGIYNVTLHPLAKYPGPKLWAAFHWPYMFDMFRGRQVETMHRLHEKYGQAVRIRPNAVWYSDGRAWKDIYSSRPGKGQMQKSRKNFTKDKFTSLPPHIILTNDIDHTRHRRLLAHAFSDQALRAQEYILNGYFRRLLEKLHGEVQGPSKGKVDMVGYFNFTTFDIIGDLTFGEPFGALEGGKYHPWIANTFAFIKSFRWQRLAGEYAPLRWGFGILAHYAPSVVDARETHFNYTNERVERRLNTETDRKDFITYIQRYNDEKGMSRDEVLANAGVLLLAGSETTATLLSGVTYHLLQNPAKLARLQEEVRSAFASVEDMSLVKTSQLPYLHAVIEEGLRMYPPVPGCLPRWTPAEGAVVAGEYVPGGVEVGVHNMSAYRDTHNFVEPFQFAPERFLPDAPAKYAHEKREALQPFSYGPRNCIGKNLAYNEMRSILARVVFDFDMELCEESRGWTDQTSIILWQKNPLMVQLTPRKQG